MSFFQTKRSLNLVAVGLLWALRAALPAGAQTPLPTPAAPRVAVPSAVAPHQSAPADTARLFSLQDLAELVFAHHPVVKQAALLSEDARAQVQQARGGFDPKLGSSFDQKIFGGTTYYNNWTNALKIPVGLGGAELKLGFDRMVGTYVNPESRTPGQGLALAGITVPLGQGLLLDERRSTLRQARLLRDAAEADRVKQINEVWLRAAQDYWNWYYTYQQLRLIREGLELAQTRFQATSRRARLGDQAPIDSVEAQITLQDRQVQYEQLRVELQNARLLLSNHLWNQDGQPVELPAHAVPQRPPLAVLDTARFEQLTQQAATRHPALLKLEAKQRQLRVEEQFRRELLKPTLNVSGNLLSRADFYHAEVPAAYGFSRNNYKLGVDVAFPLFLRKERGKLWQTRLKLQDVALEQQNSRRTILNQLAAKYNALKAYERQLAVQEQAIASQRRLLAAELQKFSLGESTLFLVNAREAKLIDLQLKQESMRATYEKTLAELYYYAGTRSAAAE